MVAPGSTSEMFTVLLNRRIIQESLNDGNVNWVGTIAHETTHVIDYLNYADLLGVADFEGILSISENAMFQLWTEFHARARGYYFVRKYSFEDMFDESQVPDIINRRYQHKNNYFIKTIMQLMMAYNRLILYLIIWEGYMHYR